MPLTLNIGLNKKIGLPEYGSLGATCSLPIELDANLLHGDLAGYSRQVRNAYAACRQAVNDELARTPSHGSVGNAEPPLPSPTAQQHPSPANGHAGNGHAGNGHRASQKQLDYANQMAGQINGLGLHRLETLAQTLFGVPLAGMSNLQASSLIDTLKEIKAGNLNLERAFNGVPS